MRWLNSITDSRDMHLSKLLGRKAMTNVDSILKSRHITVLTMIHMVKAMVFALVVCRGESWIIKKAEC